MQSGLGKSVWGGLGWTQKTWGTESAESRQTVVIGSPINAAIQIGLHRPASTNPEASWHQRIGLHGTLDHQSNGSFTQPNLGTNVVSLAASVAFSRDVRRPLRHTDTLIVVAILPKPVSGLRIHAAAGRRQPAPLGSRETVGEAGLDWRFGGGLRFGGILGAMAFERPTSSGIGVHGGFQLRFTRVHIDLVPGRTSGAGRWRNTITIGSSSTSIGGARGGSISDADHGFRAHHPALGIGWVPGGKTPYGNARR